MASDGTEIVKIHSFSLALVLPTSSALSHETLPEDDFAAPERSPNAGTGFGLLADIFSLGCVVYMMLCGFPPFDVTIGFTNLEFPSPFFDKVSDAAKVLIAEMTASNPNAQPSAEALTTHDWIRG